MEPVAQRPDGIGLLFGLLLTLVAHAAFVLILLWVNVFADVEDEPELVSLPVVSAELLMLGDVMPEDGELPWIANPEQGPQVDDDPEPPPVPEEETTLPQQETVVLDSDEPSDDVREENRAEPEEHRPELAERRNRGESDPDRPTNDRPRMGSPDGIEGGTSLSAAAIANQFARLQAQMGRAMRRPASIPESEWRRLSARVQIRVTSEGQITTWDIFESSGSQAFDDAVDSMLNRFRMGSDRLRLNTVSNDGLRQSMISNGFRVTVRGTL